MGRKTSLRGRRFGNLTVLEGANRSIHGDNKWLCKCDCGNMAIYTTEQLEGNLIQNCGCDKKGTDYQKETKKHKAIRAIYDAMINSCASGFSNKYKNENDIGIIVCSDWYDDYDNFYRWSLNNGFKLGMKFFRFNIRGDFEPDNCCWLRPGGGMDGLK